MDKGCAILNSKNIQIIDWRNMKLSKRILVSFKLIFYGFVEINWVGGNKTKIIRDIRNSEDLSQ